MASGYSRMAEPQVGEGVWNTDRDRAPPSTSAFSDFQAASTQVLGISTDSPFNRRYRIVDEADIERAPAHTQAALKQVPASNVASLREARGRR